MINIKGVYAPLQRCRFATLDIKSQHNGTLILTYG